MMVKIMRIALLVYLLLVLVAQFSLASEEQLTPAMHLRKIKFRLIGTDPSAAEYASFKKQLVECSREGDEIRRRGCIDDRLREKITEYMSDAAFVGKGVEFINSLLYLAPFPQPVERMRPADPRFWQTQDSLTLLSTRLFKENRSWLKFFTENEYDVVATPSLGLTDVQYFLNFIPRAMFPLAKGTRLRVTVPNEDVAAGFITTMRMNLRFYNTPVNEGRKRAAAILRVGFCDEMFPAIERGEEHRQVEDQIAQGKKFDEIVAGMKADAGHGQRQDCAQCHIYRSLDHLAWTFRGMELGLDKTPVAGRFTYLMPNGKVVDQPVRGLGHYVRVMAEQDPFLPCQVQNLWSEYVGNPRSLQKKPELLARLSTEIGRKDVGVKDFIATLMMLPEFRAKVAPDDTNEKFAAAERILVNCNSCHAGKQPSFTELPIMEYGIDRTQDYVEKILDQLAMSPYSRETKRQMPPKESAWQPSQADLKVILDWIEAGVPDAKGKTHISLDWLNSLKDGR